MQQFAEVRVLGLESRVAVGEGGGGADFQAIIEVFDALELGDVADVDHYRQGAVQLRHFQGQVGAAGQQARLRVGVVEVGQVGNGQGHQATFVAAVELAGFGGRDGLEAGDGLGFLRVELIGLPGATGLLGGREDRPIPGAAAQVAGQGFVGLVAVGRAAVFLQGEQRHHKARRAEAALRAVAIDHGLLDAVQLALVLEVFDADELLAVQ